jgi:hypothetical protein
MLVLELACVSNVGSDNNESCLVGSYIVRVESDYDHLFWAYES